MIRAKTGVLALLACSAAVAVSAGGGAPQSKMAQAAKGFLASLDTTQRQQALFPFTSDERLNWHYIPKERKGLPLKSMNPEQRKAALALLASGLSDDGYRKANTIRELDLILKKQENNSPTRDPDNYYFTVFGEPSDSGTWGWRYEGHHCSQNWTIAKGKAVASSPQFFGANPAEVRMEVPGAPPKGTRVLGAEEDLARALVTSLSDEQKKEAVLPAPVPTDIITKADRQAAIQEDKGIAFGKLTQEQQGKLRALVMEYVNAMPKALADERVARIRKAGTDGVKFAWMGGLEKGQGHYYRVQGSTFLIEYDNTQNNANHIHSVWRDFKGDWGMDLLAMHYQAFPHQVAAAR